MHKSQWLVGSTLIVALALVACGGDDDDSGAAGSAGTAAGGSGGSGTGATAGGGSGGSSGSSGSGGSSGSTAGGGSGGVAGSSGSGGSGAIAGSGGSAGAGATGAQGGSAGAGGSVATDCLPEDQVAQWLTISADSPLCVTRIHTTQDPVGSSFFSGFSWGKQNGPMTVANLAGLQVYRWSLPDTATGEASLEAVDIPEPSGLLAGPQFWGASQDLNAGLLLSYTTGDASSSGELLLLDTNTLDVTARAFVNGYYSGVSSTVGATERLLYVGLSELSTDTISSTSSGFYSADVCEGSLDPKTCGASVIIASWADFSGGAAIDESGNIFASMYDLTNNLFRGFSAESLLQAGPPSPLDGKDILTEQGYFLGAGAIAPNASSPGYLAVVTGDLMSYLARPASLVPYVNDSGAVVPQGTAIPSVFQPASAGTGYTVFGDQQGHIWVAIDGEMGGAFLALSRKQ